MLLISIYTEHILNMFLKYIKHSYEFNIQWDYVWKYGKISFFAKYVSNVKFL